MLKFKVLPLAVLLIATTSRAQDANTTDVGYDRAPLQQLTEFRQQHRKTIDGLLCAAAFVQDDQTYTDCTDARAPDGTTGREWCYLEVQLLEKGPKNGWNFCAPVVDYAKVRAKVRQAFEMKAAEVEKMVERLDGETRRLTDMITRFNATCGINHDAVGGRIDSIESLVSRGAHCMDKITESTGKIGLLKSTIEEVEEDIHKGRKDALKNPKNCEAVAGYEDDPTPDGIRGSYYNNEMFSGAPRAFRDDKAINLVFSGKGPIEGVSSYKFSIRWEGYIQAPEEGIYTFSTDTDCGARVFLNEKAIIVDRMPEPSEKEATTENEVPVLEMDEISGVRRVDSDPQELLGGEKYKVRIEMIHSAHLKHEDVETAVMKLYWKSANIPEEVIPAKYFFKSNPKAPLKIAGLDGDKFDISMLYDGEFAFKNDETHFIADVPQRYEGRRLIRTFDEPTMDKFTLSLNGPAVVYIASHIEDAIPLGSPDDKPWKAHETEDILSVYTSSSRSARASQSHMLKIRFIEVRDGGDLTFHVLRKKQPFLLFLEQKKQSEDTCGGEQQVLSINGGPLLKGCQSSSQESDDYSCEAALSGKHIDQKGAVWRTTGGNGAGEFIVVHFEKNVQITEFRFKPRDDPVSWPSEITLSFTEDGEDDSQTFSILHSNSLEHNTYRVDPPRITSYVKAEVTQMYINGEDTGGSFEFIGTPCNHPQPESIAAEEIQEIDVQNCDATLENIPEALPLDEGKELIALCPEQCVKSPEGQVFGVEVYSPDSTLCTATLHAGVCGKDTSQVCRALVTIGEPVEVFTGETKNGVTSMIHGPSEASLTFAAAPPLNETRGENEVKYAITFQSKSDTVPEGYIIDHGDVKKKNDEIFYGWLRPAKAVSCTEVKHMNPLNAAGVSFPPSPHSEECKTGDSNCEQNFWSITLPENGKYRVESVVGSACEPHEGNRTSYLQLNGQQVVRGESLAKGEFYGSTAEIDVADKLLVVTATCDTMSSEEEKCKNAHTTISALKIEKIKGGNPEVQPEVEA